MNASYRRDFAEIQEAAVSNTNRKKKQKTGRAGKKNWAVDSPGADFLKENFQLFRDTNGSKGFDPKLTSPRAINAIYDANPELHDYIRDRFSVNYIGTAARFETNKEKEGTRSVGLRRSKYCIVFLL